MDEPARVLLANTCGTGRGHIVNLRVAARALGPGFSFDAAIYRLDHAAELEGPLGARIIRCPGLSFGPHSQATPARGASATWGQYLADIGLCRPDLVRRHLRWWRQRIIESNAAILIADVAPLAVLAAKGLQADGWEIEIVVAGTGYSATPGDLPAFPLLLPDVPVMGHDEAALTEQLNGILSEEGIPKLPALPAIHAGVEVFATTLPLFDPYDGKRGHMAALPPLERLPPIATDGGDEVFCYISSERGQNPKVLETLAELPLKRRGYLPGLPRAEADRLADSGMILHDKPLAPEEIAARSRLFVNLGQHGTLVMGALMGLPQVAFTQHLEHLFHARKLAAKGCCLIRRPNELNPDDAIGAIVAAYDNPILTDRAQALATALRAGVPADPAAARAARLAPLAARARSYG